MSLFIYIKVLKKDFVIFRNWGMDTAYSVASMTLYLVFFSSLATIVMSTWKIFDMAIQFPIGETGLNESRVE